MIRYSTTRSHNGKKVKAGDIVEGSDRQKQRLLDCGQAYEETINESSTVPEIKAYMKSEGIEFSSSMNKSELLEKIDDSGWNTDISN